jgi:apolipoprotein N-acyltransferase
VAVPVALAAGAMHAGPASQPAGWPLQVLAVAVLVALVAGVSRQRAALLGGLFGTAWLCAAVWWLFISMHRYGGLPAPLAAGAVLALCAFLSLYLAAALAVVAPRLGGPGVLRPAAGFAAAWLLAELARGRLFTGFPWAAAGYGHVDSPLASWAPWVGVYGIGALAAFGAAVAVFAARALWQRAAPARGVLIRAGAALALVVAPGLLPVPDFTEPGATLRVVLLQTNVSQDQKFSVEAMPEALAWTKAAMLAAEADLVVGPETVIPLLPDQLQSFIPDLWPALRAHFGQPGRHALVGLPLGSFEEGYTNSAAGLSQATVATGPPGFYRYDKHHLVPFGEFIPTGFRWFTELMNIPLGDFNRGPLAPPSFEVRSADGRLERIGPNICYEDLFGEELATRFRDAGMAPSVLANLSNIGWFGDTVAIPQHLHITRLRTLELQRPMLRSTNTGATAIVDHRARVTHQLAPLVRGTLAGSVQGRHGVTPYAAWASRAGLWPLVALAVLGVAAAGRRARPRHPPA